MEQGIGTMSGFVLIRPGRRLPGHLPGALEGEVDFAALTASGDHTRTTRRTLRRPGLSAWKKVEEIGGFHG